MPNNLQCECEFSSEQADALSEAMQVMGETQYDVAIAQLTMMAVAWVLTGAQVAS